MLPASGFSSIPHLRKPRVLPNSKPSRYHEIHAALFRVFMRLQRWIISTLLVLLVLAVYWPVKNYDFVNVNDFEYVSKNDHINADFSWPGVRWALTSQVAANWHPVTVFSHMLDCQIYGLNAGGHHFTSVLLHLASVLLLFSILLKMTTKTPEDLAANFWPCAVVTALFALHPLRVESVVWISERKDVLSVFFFMLTLWSYLHYVKKKEAKSKGGTWYFLALLFFALGLMSKPMLVTLPCALLLLDYWPLKRVRVESESEAFSFGKLFLEKIPFFLLTVVFSVVTFLTQKGAGAMGSLEKLPISARLANAMVSYARYLGKTVWPDSLAGLYPMPEGWAAWKIAGAVALFVTLSLFAIFNVRRKPYLFMGWFWFVGMLVPVIGLVQVGTQAMADRFTYLPSIGLFMAVVWGLSDIFAAWNKRVLIPVTGAILAVGCVAVTANQVHYWQDTETLLQHTVALTGKNPRANATLGTTFANKNQWAEAERHLGKAIEEKPDFAEAYGDLGGVYARQGKLDDAQHAYEKALQLKPALPLAHFGLANIYRDIGRTQDAMREYRNTLNILSNNELYDILAYSGGFNTATLAGVCRNNIERLKTA